MTVFVSNTTASCTGILFCAEGTPEEIEAVHQAVKVFNQESSWQNRNSDGTVYLQESEAAVISFWRDQMETDAVTFEEIQDVLRDDGAVIRCGASDLADYLVSLDRQVENLLPKSL